MPGLKAFVMACPSDIPFFIPLILEAFRANFFAGLEEELLSLR